MRHSSPKVLSAFLVILLQCFSRRRSCEIGGIHLNTMAVLLSPRKMNCHKRMMIVGVHFVDKRYVVLPTPMTVQDMR